MKTQIKKIIIIRKDQNLILISVNKELILFIFMAIGKYLFKIANFLSIS